MGRRDAPTVHQEDWTVHDGQSFAQSINGGQRPRAPQEVRFLSPKATTEAVPVAGQAPTWSRPKPVAKAATQHHGAWSVHDGKAFAASIRSGAGHTPDERAGLVAAPGGTASLLQRWATEWHNQDTDWAAGSQRLKWRAQSPTLTHRAPRKKASLKNPGGLTKPISMSMDEIASAKLVSPFSDYKLLKPLGMGQFATVYAARHVSSGQQVAIKMTTRPIRPSVPVEGAKLPEAPPLDPMDASCFSLEVSSLLMLARASEAAHASGSARPGKPLYRAHGLVDLDGGAQHLLVREARAVHSRRSTTLETHTNFKRACSRARAQGLDRDGARQRK